MRISAALVAGTRGGARSDGRSTWMLVPLTLLTAPIVFAFSYRLLPAARPQRPRRRQPTVRGAR